jgi:hypothetical protein
MSLVLADLAYPIDPNLKQINNQQRLSGIHLIIAKSIMFSKPKSQYNL